MAAVRKKHLAELAPYLVGESEKPSGEIDMYCPLHSDGKRSAGINIKKGVWYCQAGCGGGPVTQLMRQRDDFIPPKDPARNGASSSNGSDKKEELSEAKVKGWISALFSDKEKLKYLTSQRGLTLKQIRRYELGRDGKYITIPVRDEDGELGAIRRYDIKPGIRRKMWSFGSPRLYPVSILDEEPEEIIVCEGEWDALLTIQHGFAAITKTGAADVWEAAWGANFKGKIVYLCHDRDNKGQVANRKIGKALENVAREVRVITLPYEHTEKHGKDLTDFWSEHGKPEFRQLMRMAEPLGGHKEEPEDLDPADASVLDSFDSRKVGKPLRLTLTIKGKRDPGYSIPSKIEYTCTQDAGHKCNTCPMMAMEGHSVRDVGADDPIILEMIEATKQQLGDVMRKYQDIPKCNRLTMEIQEHQAVEQLFARPSIDHVAQSEEAGDYKNIKITSVGRHNTLPNNTVQVVGALYPDPRKQLNEFLAWDVQRKETSLDNFEVGKREIKLMKRFQPGRGQRPLKKLGDIARDMSAHVTNIYGRPEMHATMDLVFHSAIGFNFGGQYVHKGWLDVLFVGDTRTGKSEAATKLTQHYGVGEIVSCESASFAGIVGGVQQYGSNKEWAISWGAIPINDRRLVVLDEISGLTPENIAQMSSVRSSGTAELTKIQQEKTFARTRLMWLGNPRGKKVSEFTYGVQAIQPLIGNSEDIARFDLAMSVVAGEVSSDEINRQHETGTLRYSEDASRALVRWVWSRKPDQVHWARGAEKAVYAAASDMGQRYVEDPPLVQVANVRIKIARVAVALAARLFSTDRTHEKIVVTKEHVEDAVAFMDRLYNMQGFGYAELSRDRLADEAEARQKQNEIRKYLRASNRRDLAKFLRTTGTFRREDIEQVLNTSKDEANAVINTLWKARMVKKSKGDIQVEATLHELLRETKS